MAPMRPPQHLPSDSVFIFSDVMAIENIRRAEENFNTGRTNPLVSGF
ncbi:hypothetical protein [Desulfosarcina widdelii]|nr:hypothetical protein [Desulfosarcina widdelii]